MNLTISYSQFAHLSIINIICIKSQSKISNNQCNYTAIIFANMEQYCPIYVLSLYQDRPVYTVTVPLQCRRVCIYVKTEFPYYSVAIYDDFCCARYKNR